MYVCAAAFAVISGVSLYVMQGAGEGIVEHPRLNERPTVAASAEKSTIFDGRPYSNMQVLSSIYDLKFESGHMMKATYGNEECKYPLTTTYLLVLDDELWTKFTRDRLYLWHKGRAMIDIISKDGNFKSVCLGDTLEDKDCRYIVHIPEGKTTRLSSQGATVVSETVLGGSYKDGEVFSLQDIVQEYSNTNLFIKMAFNSAANSKDSYNINSVNGM